MRVPIGYRRQEDSHRTFRETTVFGENQRSSVVHNRFSLDFEQLEKYPDNIF